MATITKAIGQLHDDVSGLVATAEVDYDDALLRLTVFRLVNPTARAIEGTVVRTSDQRAYTREFPAAATTVLAIPQQAASRVPITLDPRGRLLGIEFAFRWVVL